MTFVCPSAIGEPNRPTGLPQMHINVWANVVVSDFILALLRLLTQPMYIYPPIIKCLSRKQTNKKTFSYDIFLCMKLKRHAKVIVTK